MSTRSARARAFTLIELLVVISIIALLIAILLPAVRRARESARNVVCLSGLRQIGIAVAQYTEANGQFLPPASAASLTAFDVLLDPYLNTLPPLDSTAETGGLWTCPSDHLPPNRGYVQFQRRSYGLNYYLGNVAFWFPPAGVSANIEDITGRATVIADTWEAVIGTRSEMGAAQVWYGPSTLALFHYEGNLFGLFHFETGGNYLFVDGSAESFAVDAMWDRADLAAPRNPDGTLLWE